MPKHEIVPIWVIGGTSGLSYFGATRKVNPSTLLWSIKKEKWFNGTELPNDLIRHYDHDNNFGVHYYDIYLQDMCATSVGSNSVFILSIRKTFSFNVKTKLKVNQRSSHDMFV